MSLSRNEQFSSFISGWTAAKERFIEEITSYSSPWLPNGPSFATAKAILIKLNNIPLPKSEDEVA